MQKQQSSMSFAAMRSTFAPGRMKVESIEDEGDDDKRENEKIVDTPNAASRHSEPDRLQPSVADSWKQNERALGFFEPEWQSQRDINTGDPSATPESKPG